MFIALGIFTTDGEKKTKQIIMERIQSVWHKTKHRGHLTNVTAKVNES